MIQKVGNWVRYKKNAQLQLQFPLIYPQNLTILRALPKNSVNTRKGIRPTFAHFLFAFICINKHLQYPEVSFWYISIIICLPKITINLEHHCGYNLWTLVRFPPVLHFDNNWLNTLLPLFGILQPRICSLLFWRENHLSTKKGDH